MHISHMQKYRIGQMVTHPSMVTQRKDSDRRIQRQERIFLTLVPSLPETPKTLAFSKPQWSLGLR